VLGLLAACGGHGVPDAFEHGVPHARLLFDRVNCDPSPETCTRYVILAPEGRSTPSLLTVVRRRAADLLQWVPTHTPQVVEPDEGKGYDGPGKTGGFINTADQELHYWIRVGYVDEKPPNPTVQRAEALMRAYPDAVVVRIDSA
jgi:hypothetical protein